MGVGIFTSGASAFAVVDRGCTITGTPEADTLIFINPQRILNEAAPRLMPEKDLAEMRKGFGEMKQFVGVDPARLDYLVIVVRFRKPSADLSFNPPELMAVAAI